MIFADRVNHLEAEGAYVVLARANELAAQGRDIIHDDRLAPGFCRDAPGLSGPDLALLTHSIGCTAGFSQVAGIEALTGSQEMVDQMVAAFQARRERMIAGLSAIPGIRCQVPEGAFYAFPNVSSFGIPSKQLALRILDEAGVAVLSGADFGPYGEGYLRLCYANSLENIEQALERLAGFLRE